ncbi:hypothetical protein ABZ863_03320 [Saccharomonospora sp. NPDC046836]|uniref:hypothetical protein n=1 Tax=Saccharomonospora sp. NPDC046836 TaxID=3156921 RepID=UPI0033CF93AA
MSRAVLAVLAAVAVLVTGAASRPADAPSAPQQHRTTVAAQPTAQQPHRVHIVVSGPYDTLMRVARGSTGSQVALRGEPFDFTFVEPAGQTGYLTIKVAAASEHPGGTPVRCEIQVNGAVVSAQSASEPDASGLTQVLCTVPTHV